MLQKNLLIFLFSFLLLEITSLQAQHEDVIDQIESLLVKDEITTNDKPDSTIARGQKVLNLAQRVGHRKYEGEGHFEIGRGYMGKGQWLEAHESFQTAKDIFHNIGDSLAMAAVLNQMGYSFQAMRQYDKALESVLNALRLRKKFNAEKRLVASSEGGIGFIYQNIGDLEKAMEHHMKALDLRRSLKKPPRIGIGLSMKNLGVVHFKKGEYEIALKYLKEALDTFMLNDNRQFIRSTRIQIGDVLMAQNKLQEAEREYLISQKMADETGGVGTKARSYSRLGRVYQKMGEYQKAIDWLTKSVEFAEQSGDRKILTDNIYQPLAEALFEVGATEKAFLFLQKHAILQDSVYSEESAKRTALLKTEYETDLIEKENQNLRSQQELRVRERNYLILGLGLVLILLFLIFRENRQRKKAFNHLLKEKNKTESLLQELKDAQMQLIQSEKMASLGLLTAGIAHEINNPINFIASNVQALKLDFQEIQQLLEKVKKLESGVTSAEIIALEKTLNSQFLQEEIDELIGGIERGAERTQHIISGLRTFSRDVGENFAEANIHEGLDATLILLSNKFRHQINVHKKYGNLPFVNCQFEKINQVFMNVLSNAIDAIDGEGDIHITTRYLKKNNEVSISIKDSGKGMNEVTRQRIFEPFYTTKDIGKGTGLGLAISYGIIEKHKGRMEVISDEGKGTEFVISLPVSLEGAKK